MALHAKRPTDQLWNKTKVATLGQSLKEKPSFRKSRLLPKPTSNNVLLTPNPKSQSRTPREPASSDATRPPTRDVVTDGASGAADPSTTADGDDDDDDDEDEDDDDDNSLWRVFGRRPTQSSQSTRSDMPTPVVPDKRRAATPQPEPEETNPFAELTDEEAKRYSMLVSALSKWQTSVMTDKPDSAESELDSDVSSVASTGPNSPDVRRKSVAPAPEPEAPRARPPPPPSPMATDHGPAEAGSHVHVPFGIELTLPIFLVPPSTPAPLTQSPVPHTPGVMPSSMSIAVPAGAVSELPAIAVPSGTVPKLSVSAPPVFQLSVAPPTAVTAGPPVAIHIDPPATESSHAAPPRTPKVPLPPLMLNVIGPSDAPGDDKSASSGLPQFRLSPLPGSSAPSAVPTPHVAVASTNQASPPQYDVPSLLLTLPSMAGSRRPSVSAPAIALPTASEPSALGGPGLVAALVGGGVNTRRGSAAVALAVPMPAQLSARLNALDLISSRGPPPVSSRPGASPAIAVDEKAAGVSGSLVASSLSLPLDGQADRLALLAGSMSLASPSGDLGALAQRARVLTTSASFPAPRTPKPDADPPPATQKQSLPNVQGLFNPFFHNPWKKKTDEAPKKERKLVKSETDPVANRRLPKLDASPSVLAPAAAAASLLPSARPERRLRETWG